MELAGSVHAGEPPLRSNLPRSASLSQQVLTSRFLLQYPPPMTQSHHYYSSEPFIPVEKDERPTGLPGAFGGLSDESCSLRIASAKS